jgi:hypothetical protein
MWRGLMQRASTMDLMRRAITITTVFAMLGGLSSYGISSVIALFRASDDTLVARIEMCCGESATTEEKSMLRGVAGPHVDLYEADAWVCRTRDQRAGIRITYFFPGDTWCTAVYLAVGWPWPSASHLRHGVGVETGGYWDSVQGLRLIAADGGPVYLPLRPLWPGLLANTAFHGAILCALWFALGTIRPGLRRRQGACMRCGYDLRGSERGACPECGASTAK